MQKRSLAFLLALILLLSTFVSVAVVPASAAEADVADVSTAVSESYSMLDGKASISSNTDNDACYSASSENGIFTATARCVVEVDEETEEETLVNGSGTVVVTNTGSNILSFVYRVSSQEGTVEMENDDITGSTDTVNLATGESVEFSVFSSVNQYTQNPAEAYATLSLSDFTEIQPADGVAYIEENPHARITANGEEVEDDSIEFYSSQGLELRAELDPGYGFLAWVNADTGVELSSVQSVILHPQGDLDIELVVYEKGSVENYGVKLPAYTNEAKFETLSAAIAFENGTANKTITVLQDVDYTETNCVIPSGTTLLVPFDYARTIYRETPEVTPPSVKYVTPTAYREMTMKPGSSLTVANGGSICLSGKLSAVGQNLKSCCGTPTGPDGRIHMEGNSKINIQNGGKLYAWGYITGKGNITVKSGATAYEHFTIADDAE